MSLSCGERLRPSASRVSPPNARVAIRIRHAGDGAFGFRVAACASPRVPKADSTRRPGRITIGILEPATELTRMRDDMPITPRPPCPAVVAALRAVVAQA